MKNSYVFLFALLVLNLACGSPEPEEENPKVDTASQTAELVEQVSPSADSVVLSFVFVGCNRVDRGDVSNPAATDKSSANIAALQRLFAEVSAMNRKPDLFFFLGDLVYGESTLPTLNSQLQAWANLYANTTFSGISTSGIEMVAVPGNHEMLTYKKVAGSVHTEWPLKGSIDIWLKYMSGFMPQDRDTVSGVDSYVNKATFSFVRKNVAFIVMNTDTYNPPTKEHPYGWEGMIPMQWITDKVEQYKQDPAVEHIFVLGHKPCYVNGKLETGHDGLPEGPVLWPQLQHAGVNAMLSAHVHDYDRMQPGDTSTYQIIAGNGGSSGPAAFFGYSVIHILKSGKIQLLSKGYDVGVPYYQAVPNNPTTIRDSTILTRTKNTNPYRGQ